MKILRKKGVIKVLVWTIAVVIIISFGFLGTAYLITDQFSQNYAGKIFGKKISLQDFQKAFQQTQVQAIMRYGDNFQQMQKFMNFDNETWDRILLLHDAKRRKIQVSNAEVIDTIEALPFFQRDGQFDTLIYNDILRFYFRLRPNEFEETIRDNIRISKIVESVTADVTISEDEAFAKFKEKHDQVKIQYSVIEHDAYLQEAPVDESQAKAAYEANPAAFEIPASINVSYIRLPFPETPVDESAEPPATEDNNDTTANPEHSEAWMELRQKAEALSIEILNGASLSETALSLGVEAQETGFFNTRKPDLSPGWSFNTVNYLFQADMNESLGPIETDEAFLIVQLKDRRDAFTPEFEEIRDDAMQMAREESAKEIARQKASEFLNEIRSAMNQNPSMELSDIAAQFNLNTQITPAFNRGQYLPRIGISEEFQNAAFALSEDNRLGESVITTPAGPAILYLVESLPVTEEQFENEKTAFMDNLQEEKNNALFRDYLTTLRQESNLEDNIQKLRQKQATNQP